MNATYANPDHVASVGHVTDPEPTRTIRGEGSLNEIGGPADGGVRLRREDCLRPSNTANRRAQHPADGLDPETNFYLIDETDHLVVVWSSSLAKNTLAAFKLSFARRSSAFSRLSFRFCSSYPS